MRRKRSVKTFSGVVSKNQRRNRRLRLDDVSRVEEEDEPEDFKFSVPRFTAGQNYGRAEGPNVFLPVKLRLLPSKPVRFILVVAGGELANLIAQFIGSYLNGREKENLTGCYQLALWLTDVWRKLIYLASH